MLSDYPRSQPSSPCDEFGCVKLPANQDAIAFFEVPPPALDEVIGFQLTVGAHRDRRDRRDWSFVGVVKVNEVHGETIRTAIVGCRVRLFACSHANRFSAVNAEGGDQGYQSDCLIFPEVISTRVTAALTAIVLSHLQLRLIRIMTATAPFGAIGGSCGPCLPACLSSSARPWRPG